MRETSTAPFIPKIRRYQDWLRERHGLGEGGSAGHTGARAGRTKKAALAAQELLAEYKACKRRRLAKQEASTKG